MIAKPRNDNPANAIETSAIPDDFVPMSLPVQKLAVPDIPGFHLHWFEGTPNRLSQAQRAYYTFVEPDDVQLSNTNIGDDLTDSGSTDMGTRVSLSAGRGAVTEAGQPLRLYLMKQPKHLWEHSQKLLEDRNEQIAATLRGGGQLTSNPHGQDNTYIPGAHRQAVENLFTRKTRRP